MGSWPATILHGQFPTFYWGQQYGGSPEAFLTAGVFAVFGTSMLALKAVPFALDAVAALLVWRVGRRLVGESTAQIAAALFWVWPAAFIWSSVKAEGFYGVALVASLLILLLVLRLRDKGTTRDWLLLGLVLGVGWWSTPEIVFVAIPALIWLVIKRRPSVPHLIVSAAGGGVGALPWLIWNFRHNLASFRATPQPVPDNSYFNHLTGFFSVGLPGALGLRFPLSAHWLGSPAVGQGLTIAILMALAVVVARRHRQLELLLFVVVAYPFLLALSPYSWYLDDPRYLLLLSPALSLIAAALLARWLSVGTILFVAAIAIAAIGFRAIPPELPYPQNFGPLIESLNAQHVTRAFADYWVAYRLDFDSRERIIASPISPIRYSPFDTQVRNQADPAFIFLKGSLPEAEFLAQLEALGVSYRSSSVGGFSVYIPSQKVVPPAPGHPQGPIQLAGQHPPGETTATTPAPSL